MPPPFLNFHYKIEILSNRAVIYPNKTVIRSDNYVYAKLHVAAQFYLYNSTLK